ncbi:hypothetical protein DC3_58300 [Deinococcus cellulosilyticus NBRC 106333 = KACC 11606]|uniref:Uncharacterized protein n=2 Tax=Deinococcus cellulosilyticus TaxID=401558 RepID=A0A511NBJ5_DEIC1|nr:hypothetical protein DC3_58300 [Deinococcus cellulosilyticus NBRC 106333 = KACC 11606]
MYDPAMIKKDLIDYLNEYWPRKGEEYIVSASDRYTDLAEPQQKVIPPDFVLEILSVIVQYEVYRQEGEIRIMLAIGGLTQDWKMIPKARICYAHMRYNLNFSMFDIDLYYN